MQKDNVIFHDFSCIIYSITHYIHSIFTYIYTYMTNLNFMHLIYMYIYSACVLPIATKRPGQNLLPEDNGWHMV